MTLSERADAYAAAIPEYPDSRLWVSPSGRWLNGIWLLGQNYKGSGLYGAFPPDYMRRVRAIFPDVPAGEWVHLYSGSLGPEEPGLRLDLRSDYRPTVMADARSLPVRPRSLRLVSADPPYTAKDATRYGTPPVLNKPRVLRELAVAIRPGGFLIWLDTTLPIYDGQYWHHFGMVGVQRSTNHRFRLCSLFQRTAVTVATEEAA